MAEPGESPAADSPTLPEAEFSVMSARAEFADDKARHGAAVALALFNRRVSRWANGSLHKRLGQVMYTVGIAMDGETHSRQISVNGPWQRDQGQPGPDSAQGH